MTNIQLSTLLLNEIGQSTRLLSIELIIFNNNSKTLSDFRLIVKKSPSGLNFLNWKIFTLKLTEIFHLKIIFSLSGLFLAYYGYEKINEIRKGEFLKPYRLLGDIFDIMIFWFSIMTLICSVRLYKFLSISINLYKFNLNDIIQSKDDDYYNIIMIYIDEYYYFIYNFSMFTVVSFSRLLKHSIIYRPFEIIIRSLRTICYNILQFSPFVFLIFIAFALFGVSVFSPIMSEYETLSSAIITLISILLGELNYEKYYDYNSFIGTVYFCSYVIVIAIICFNIISAIITESYESVKTYLNDESQKYHITPDNENVQRNFNLIIRLKLDNYAPDVRIILEAMVQKSSSNRILNDLEIDSDLKKFEYDSETLKAMMTKYGLGAVLIDWKKTQMDYFRTEITKERQELDDLFVINMKLNENEFEKRKELEISKQIFVRKEKYFNLEQKIYRLKNVVKIVDLKSKTIISNIKLLKTKN